MSLIKEPLMRIVHKLIVEALVHRLGSKKRCQKRDLWMMNALEELCGINLAWVIAEHLCKHAPGLKENSLICEGHYVTKIAKSLGVRLEDSMLRYSMLMRNNYMLEHSMPILHQFANQANFAYPTYEPTNVPPYPYLYVPYLHPYTHYPDMGNQSQGGGHYGALGDGYFVGSMPSFRGTSIVPSSGYEVGGSSRAIQDEDDDDALMSEQIVHANDDIGSQED
ncbi:hypothetical protein Tco_1206104 [Tanacetum coccineum]